MVFSCRDIQPISPLSVVSGYQFNGILTTSNGVPVQGASVRLHYYYEDANIGPIDTIQVVVVDSTKAVDVSVYTAKYFFVRTLFFGYRRPGIVPRFRWDGLDNNGVQMPSGKYYIGYQVGDSLKKFSTVILDGQITGMTDGLGQFHFSNDQLPVGDLVDVYLLNGSYDLTLRIVPNIKLEFEKQTLTSVYSYIPLKKDKTTSGAFTI